MQLPKILSLSMALAVFAVNAADLAPIVSVGVVRAAPTQVWEAWTTGVGLRSWLAPLADIDLRVDGLLRSNYNPKAILGDDGTIENRILSFEPQRMLSIKVHKAPKGFPFPNAVKGMWTVIYFQALKDGNTEVRAVGLGFTDEPESARMRDFFQRGNDYTIEQLRRRFAE